MKTWRIDYECSGVGRSGTLHLTASDLKTVCRDFHRFWVGRQETDKMVAGLPYFGALWCVKVWPWAPQSVSDQGQLVDNGPEAAGYLEWKIDGAAAGFDFLQWVEMRP